MRKKSIGIGKIGYGEGYLYFPIKLLNIKSTVDIKTKINNSKYVVSENYLMQMREHLYRLEKKYIKEFINGTEYNFEKRINLKFIDNSNDSKFKCFPEYEFNLERQDKNNIILTINAVEEKITYNFIDELDVNQNNMTKIYGRYYTDNYEVFLIRTSKIIIDNSKSAWLNVCLFLYKNGVIIIRIGFPFIDCSINGMTENNLDSYFEKIETFDGNEFNTLKDYVRFLCEELLKRQNFVIDNSFYYINLLDFEGIPNDVRNINEELIKDLYLINCSPVPETSRGHCMEEAREYFKSNGYYLTNGLYALKTMGGCIHIVSKKMIDFNYKQLENTDLSKIDKLHKISNELCVATEFAINIILLEKISIIANIVNLSNNSNLYTEKKKYYEDQLFINQLQSNCYGTVYEQLEFFKKTLNLYSQKKLLKDRFEAIQEIINLQEINKKEKENRLISLFTVTFTLILGLPAILETLTIVKDVLYKPDLLPNVSLKEISFIVWLVLVILLPCLVRKINKK